MQRLGQCLERWGVGLVDATEASATTSTVLSQFEKIIIGGLANGGPARWFNMDDRGAVYPISRHCFKAPKPFEWQAAPYGPEHDQAAYSAMTNVRQARDFRFHEDLCMPIHHDAAAGAIAYAARPMLT